MGLYRDHIFPRAVDLGMAGKQFRELRPKYLAGARGRVLEIGFGSGLNLPHYPREGIDELLGLDPALVGRKLGRKRIAAAPFPVGFVDLDGDAIPLDDRSVDTVVSTWTLCTIPAIETALREARRVLRDDGRLLFLEHGRSSDARVARWQDRVNPLQKFWACGCHLNRPIEELILAAGFRMQHLERFYMKGPKILSYMYGGTAAKGDS